MSDILNKIEEGKELELREVLLKTTYGEPMKEKFEELGVGEVWKYGQNKELLIQLALQKIEENKIKAKEESLNEDNSEDSKEDQNQEIIEENEEKDGSDQFEEDLENEDHDSDELLIKEALQKIEEQDPSVDPAAYNYSSDVDEEKSVEYTTELTKTDFTIEELERNLENIEANLVQANQFTKLILWEKQKQIIEKIKELNEAKKA